MTDEPFDLDALLLAVRRGIAEQCRELAEKQPGFIGRNNAAAQLVGEAEHAIAAEVARLTREKQEAERDSERLNWMQDNAVDVTPLMDMDPEATEGWQIEPYDAPAVRGGTLRETIDAARASSLPESAPQ